MFIKLDTKEIIYERGRWVPVTITDGGVSRDVKVKDKIFNKYDIEKLKKKFNILPATNRGKKDARYYVNSIDRYEEKPTYVIIHWKQEDKLTLDEIKDEKIQIVLESMQRALENNRVDNQKKTVLGEPNVNINNDVKKDFKTEQDLINSLGYDELVQYNYSEVRRGY